MREIGAFLYGLGPTFRTYLLAIGTGIFLLFVIYGGYVVSLSGPVVSAVTLAAATFTALIYAVVHFELIEKVQRYQKQWHDVLAASTQSPLLKTEELANLKRLSQVFGEGAAFDRNLRADYPRTNNSPDVLVPSIVAAMSNIVKMREEALKLTGVERSLSATISRQIEMLDKQSRDIDFKFNELIPRLSRVERHILLEIKRPGSSEQWRYINPARVDEIWNDPGITSVLSGIRDAHDRETFLDISRSLFTLVRSVQAKQDDEAHALYRAIATLYLQLLESYDVGQTSGPR